MSIFIIRAELNKAEEGDYERLHDELYKHRIYKVIKLENGKWADLPTGTYRGEFTGNGAEVFNLIETSLKTIGKTNTPTKRDYELSVFSDDKSWNDLKPNIDKSKLP